MAKKSVIKTEITLNRKELKNIRKILKEKNIKDNQRITIETSGGSGIGLNVYMKIEGVEQKFDVTDYDSW